MKVLNKSGEVLCVLDKNMDIVSCKNDLMRELLSQYRTLGMETMVPGEGYIEDEFQPDAVKDVKLGPNTVGVFIEKMNSLGLQVED